MWKSLNFITFYIFPKKYIEILKEKLPKKWLKTWLWIQKCTPNSIKCKNNPEKLVKNFVQ